MAELKFVRFQAEDYALYEAWSEEDEINHWLGSATTEWRDYILATQESFVWMIYDGDNPVANLEVDLLEDDASQAQVSYMVAPGFRRQGYGRQVLTCVLEQPELQGVRRFYAFVKPANVASVGLLTALGYTLVSPEPSEQGYVEYAYVRSV